MASTNKTPNYNLSQFIATDKPAWLTDYNGDMSKVDTAVKNVSDRVGVNETAITEAEANIEDNASNITTLQATTGQHGTDITDLKAQDIIIKNDVTNLGTRVTALENKIVIDELWTNPNPNTQMDSTSITFNYNDYRLLVIVYTMNALSTQAIYSSDIMMAQNNTINTKTATTSGYITTRSITLTSNGANVGNCTLYLAYQSSPQGRNDLCVPYKIYGIK